MERIIPGLLIAGSWLLLLLFGSIPFFNVIIVLVIVVAADEYVKMADPRGLPVTKRALIDCIIALPAVSVCFFPDPAILPLASILSFAALTCYFLYHYRNFSESYNLFTRLVFGLFYVGILGAHCSLLRALPEGANWLIIASAITASSDTGAYFVGKRFGRRKLCPNISPNKTIEGAVGGVGAGVMAAVFFAVLLLPSYNLFFIVTAATFLAIIGIAGDLTESIIKRGTGAKDSGSCLAGHGGILDRVDSLLFVAPVLYYLLINPVV